MWLFKCKHPFVYLAVEKDTSSEIVDEDFNRVTLHLRCMKCNTPLDRKYMQLRKSVDDFLTGGRRALATNTNKEE